MVIKYVDIGLPHNDAKKYYIYIYIYSVLLHFDLGNINRHLMFG